MPRHLNDCRQSIGWADYTWNPVTGCLHGCYYCYARRIAERFRGTPSFPNGFEPTFHPERLNAPLRLREPSRIFVGSMTDLGGEWVQDDWFWQTMEAIAFGGPHTYFMLTKNPTRLRSRLSDSTHAGGLIYCPWPLPNLYVGTTVINQADADERIPLLLKAPAAARFVSIEPLLGPVDLIHRRINWVIIGAQTGPGAVRPEPEWVQSIIDQCRAVRVPVYVKSNVKWYEDIREFPS